MNSISRPVRLAVYQEFANQFNARLAQACAAFNITAFEIDFSGASGNYFQGPVEFGFLFAYLEKRPSTIPALCLYSGGASSEGFTHPNVFSGTVAIGGEVFLRYPPTTTDFESLPEAVEASIAGIIHESETDAWAGATYNDDLRIGFGDFVFNTGSIYRAVQFQLSFQV